ncbi:MAG: ROK family protein [Phycisphaerales bacterium]
MTLPGPRQREILRMVYRHSQVSRSDLHEQTGIRLNTIGAETAALLEQGVLRECDVQAHGRGRPRVPLEIDPHARHVIGLAISRGSVEIGRINLNGKLIGEPIQQTTTGRADALQAAAALLKDQLNDDTLAVGLTAPGFIDLTTHQMLFSPTVPSGKSVSLKPIYDAAGAVPIALENDAVALAARWALAHKADAETGGDVLIIRMGDGRLGSTLLVNGRPNRGSVTGANELGHTRLPVEAPVCFCGQTGCLERICSTEYLTMCDGGDIPLAQRAASYDGTDAAVNKMLDLLTIGYSNAVNFTRVSRMVIASELTTCQAFTQGLIERVRSMTLSQLDKRLRIDLWDRTEAQPARVAASLILAHLYTSRWASLLAVAGEVRDSGAAYQPNNLQVTN